MRRTRRTESGAQLGLDHFRQLVGEALDELDPDSLSPALRQVIIVVTVIGFFSIFWVKNGQTLGMQAWRIKLVTVDGETLTMKHCLLRAFGAMLSIACLGLGYLWCLFDRQKRYWHDSLSGTRLVLLPKRKKKDGGKN